VKINIEISYIILFLNFDLFTGEISYIMSVIFIVENSTSKSCFFLLWKLSVIIYTPICHLVDCNLLLQNIKTIPILWADRGGLSLNFTGERFSFAQLMKFCMLLVTARE